MRKQHLRTRTGGFTLVEVIAAVLALSLVFSFLTVTVGRTLARLGTTRVEIEAVRLGEERMREILAQAEAGELPEPGVREGVFEDNGAGGATYAFRLDVEPFTPPLPEGTPPELARASSLFRVGDGNELPPVRRVILRVFPELDGVPDPSQTQTFIALVTEPPAAPPQPGTASPGPGEGAEAPPQ